MITRSSPYSRDVITGSENGKPVILPGASRQYEFPNDKVMCPQPDSSPPDEVPCSVALEAAFFADGSHDGDAEVLAEIEGRDLSWTSNQPQLQELVRNILRDSSLTDAKRVALLRSEIPKLPEERDATAIDQIRQRYPSLSDEAWQGLEKSISQSADAEKQFIPRQAERI